MRRIFVLAAAFAVAACSGGTPSGYAGALDRLGPSRDVPKPDPARRLHRAREPLVQQPLHGVSGATTQNYGYDTNGKKISLQPTRPRDRLGHRPFVHGVLRRVRRHGHASRHRLQDGRLEQRNRRAGRAEELAVRVRAAQSEIEPYWEMARQYVLADDTFASNLDGSFIAHQYVVAAYASRAVDYPHDAWGCEGGRADTVDDADRDSARSARRIRACFDNPTHRDRKPTPRA